MGENLMVTIRKPTKVVIIIFQIGYFICILAIFRPPAAWGESDAINSDKAVDNAFKFLNFQMDNCVDAPATPVCSNTKEKPGNRSDSARFIQSYAYLGCNFGSPEHAAYLYDQALVLLAYLARGFPADLKRAKMIADAIVLAQENDRTFKDGRLRNAYICGVPLDPKNGYARLPGRWNDEKKRFYEDEYAVGSDTGNLAWAAIALIQADKLLAPVSKEKYRQAAIRLADWIVVHTAAKDSWGGFYGGFAGGEQAIGDPNGPQRLTWRSTEHNIDLVALFKLLEAEYPPKSTERQRWRLQRNQALNFVNKMWAADKAGKFLLTGLGPQAKERNHVVIPLDAQSWSVLALNAIDGSDSFLGALQWAMSECRANEFAYGYDFNCHDGDGAWWEGTAQIAVALKMVKHEAPYKKILDELHDAQIQTGTYNGAMPAASKCGLTTGFYKLWISSHQNLPWLYTDNPHVGATAWFIFALLGKNPFRP
jgi:hypothetical protein